MNSLPLVSIICTCYNHGPYIASSLFSVFQQTYSSIELIVIDDYSLDNSVEEIEKVIKDRPEVVFIRNNENQGICKNFNRGLQIAKGEFLIDLSGDDLLEPGRVEEQVSFFQRLDENYGVVYSNASIVDEKGQFLRAFFSDNNPSPQSGDVYKALIEFFMVPAPTMMFRKSLIDQLDGYDEELSYEDFDFWIRSSRKCLYAYQDELLTKIRITPNSLSSTQYNRGDPQLMSTYRVCEKIAELNQSEEEDQALIRRLKYEITHAVLAGKNKEANLFFKLLKQYTPLSLKMTALQVINRSNINLSVLRNLLIRIR